MSADSEQSSPAVRLAQWSQAKLKPKQLQMKNATRLLSLGPHSQSEASIQVP